ncbi:MTH1187 family thiamine-binding protein [Anaerobacillus isosaccharinicus]|uniref:MTH1187 family thiamine-binding protein n=1 Tax=Anaerobacillus isosaccharinicus TaxID=1532552 RepID=A0A1S2L030_9BACI|nr:MTH1187 family thiamine-binding protein [Anaerobacillus isosaccharinicus]MBA5584291.1 MTH1187 family thiamine-binding protein [Anaerobacillus isosaccharinicus]QOY37309.1 MTH1187 family thiamine-binding protein [Anaerobacillus isosaccharinicus]
MPILEISVVPVGSNSPSFSSNVSQAVNIIKEKGLNYQVTPTATVIEGSLDELMEVAKQIHQNEISNGTQRVVTNICIDDRIDKPMTLEHQVEVVDESTH